MAALEADWSEVKKVVRSVLLADVKKGMKLNSLKHRYRELYNAPLEPEKFGFDSLYNLLKAMPDVVRFQRTNDGVVLHAEVENMDSVYLTPALKRTAQKLKNNAEPRFFYPRKRAKDVAFNSDSESEGVPRKRVYFKDFKTPYEVQPCLSEETDPLRREIADQMKPNTRGFYAIVVPRRYIGSVEDVEDVFGFYGKIKDVSRTNRFCFIRYGEKHEAVSAVLETREKYGTAIPTERGCPQQVIKAKDITNKPNSTRQMSTAVSTPLIRAASMKEQNFEDVEIFVGNININSTENDVLELFSGFDITKKRFVTKETKRFAFLTVAGLDNASEICSCLNRSVLDGRRLVVQVSYVNTNESMPALEPAIPEEDKLRFTNPGQRGVYKQLTNFANYDSDDEESNWNKGDKPESIHQYQNRPRQVCDESGSSLSVNVLNHLNLEDDLPVLEDSRYTEPDRTVSYYPPRGADSFIESSGRESWSDLESDSDMEELPLNAGTKYDVLLEGFPHHTHYKQIYKEFRTIGIERVKVNVVSNYPPYPTLAIATFDNEASVQEALKWNGEEFNHRPMYIKRVDMNLPQHVKFMNAIQSGKRNEEFNEEVRSDCKSSVTSSTRGRGARQSYPQGLLAGKGTHFAAGRGQRGVYHKNHHPSYRGAYNRPHTARCFLGGGNMSRAPSPSGYQFQNPGHRGGYRPPRFPNQHMQRPYQRGFVHRGGMNRGYPDEKNQPSPASQSDPFEPTENDYALSAQIDNILRDCFPEGCLPWISKDLPEKSEVHISELINDSYFFGHVTNGLPGIEIKELTRKMNEKNFNDGAMPYTDASIRRCGALYSDSPDEPKELFRAWIREFDEDGTCEVFFIDWGNKCTDSSENLKILKDIHWTMRPQIVLFKIDDTSTLEVNQKYTLRVLTRNVYENNYVVPVELITPS